MCDRTCTGLFALLAASLLVGALAGTASARTNAQKGREAWLAGKKLFDSGDYRSALARFEEGYRLSKRGGFLYNMAECARAMGDKAKARELYRQYVRDFPRGSRREDAKRYCLALGGRDCEGKKTSGSASTTAPVRAVPTTAPTVEHKPYLPPSRPPPRDKSTPIYKHWGFWAGVGAVVVAGSITAIVLGTRSGEPSIPDGDYVADFRK